MMCSKRDMLIVMLLSFFSLQAAESVTLKFAWGGDWEPFWKMNLHGTPSGFDYDILYAAAKRSGYDLTFDSFITPWKRNLMFLELGSIDVSVSASWTAKRAEFAYFTIPYRSELVGLYFRTEEINKYQLKSIEDLLKYKKIKVGADRGYTYGEKIDLVLKALGDQVEYIADNATQNREKLILGRIDCYLGYPAFEIFSKGEKLVELHPMPLINTGDIHIILSKKSVSVDSYTKFNAALKTIMSDGTYDSIVHSYVEKYGVKNWY